MKIKNGMILRKVGEQHLAVSTGEAAEIFSGIVKLNDTGLEVWNGIDAGLDADAIADQLVEKYAGVSKETALADVQEIIDNLMDKGIVEA